MQDSADKATSIALSGPKKRKQVKNALVRFLGFLT